MIRLYDAWVLRRILTGAALDGELEFLSETWRSIADRLISLPVDERLDVWTSSLADRGDREQIILALANVNSEGPAPPIQGDGPDAMPSQPAQNYPILTVGQPVKALDRGNYGSVAVDLGDRAAVHFVSNDGHEATPVLPKSILVNPDGSPLGEIRGAPRDDWPPLRLGDAPPAKPFPDIVLPERVNDFVHAVSSSVGCPPDFVGLSCLVVGGSAIGRSVSLMLKPGYFASAALYGMNVGGPSSGKSPALDAVANPMWEIDRQLHDTYVEQKKDHDRRRKDKENPAKDEEPPALESAVLEDCTVEAVAAHLALNPRGLLVSRDEGSAWVASLGQYKSGGRGADRQFWLSALYGKPIRVDRKGNPDLVPVRIPHPFLSLIGNMPPEMLSELRERGGRSDGFVERILFALPESVPRRYWSETGIGDETKRDWAEIMRWLRARPLAISPEGRAHPHVVTFTPEAKALWVDWYNAHVDETNASGYDAGDLAVDGKLCDFAARLALILQMLRLACDPTNHPASPVPLVSKWAVVGAIRLWDYFRAHHRRARWFMAGGIGNSDARSILEWIKKNRLSSFPESELTRNFPRFREGPEALSTALEWLESRGAIRRAAQPQRPPGTPGRKPGPTWLVNPALCAPENCGNCLNPAENTA
jgi:hypothetical protein